MTKVSKYINYKQEWIEAYNNGNSYRKIAEMYGVSKATVKKLIIDDIVQRPIAPTLQYIDEWVKLYEDGWSIHDIGAKYGYSAPVVFRRLKEANIIEPRETKRKTFKKFIPEMIKMYNEGLPLSQIAEKIGCHAQTVHNLLKESNIDMRSYSVSSRIYPLNEECFDEITTNDKAYWLGFLFATSSANTAVNTCFIILSVTDDYLSHLELFSKYIQTNKPIVKRKSENRYDLRLNSKKLYEDCQKFGFSFNKKEIHFPAFLSPFLKKAFLLGYCDYMSKYSSKEQSYYIFSYFNDTFLNEIQKFIFEETGISFIRETDSHKLSCANPTEICKFLDWLYEDETLYFQPKYEEYLTLKHNQ